MWIKLVVDDNSISENKSVYVAGSNQITKVYLEQSCLVSWLSIYLLPSLWFEHLSISYYALRQLNIQVIASLGKLKLLFISLGDDSLSR